MGISFDALYGVGDAAPAPAIVYRLVQLDVLATENGDRGWLIANATGGPLAVARARMAATVYGGRFAVRGVVAARLYHGVYLAELPFQSSQVLADLTISPEHPSDAASLAPQAILLPPGEGISFTTYTEDGGGASWVSLQVAYYLAEVT